jgi:hypothetical protein
LKCRVGEELPGMGVMDPVRSWLIIKDIVTRFIWIRKAKANIKEKI